ncbi:MAG: PAS domain S-box protein [Ignavibacteriaceae bacterium]|nr:PAS domain S-box protein [Ignavibacteriaceae bacterium]
MNHKNNFFDITDDIVFLTDRNFKIITVNAAAVNTLGFTREEFPAKNIPDCTHFPDGEPDLNLLAGNGEKVKCRLINSAGEQLTARLRVTPEPGTDDLYYFIFRDETELRQVKKERNYYSALLNESFKQTPIPMLLVTVHDMKMTIINDALVKFLEVEDEPDYTGWNIAELNPSWQHFKPDGRMIDFGDVPIARALRGEKIVGEIMKIITKKGNSKWCIVSGSPIYDKKGGMIAAYIIFPEITAEITAEQALKQSEKMFKLLAENTQDVIWTLDPATGKFMYVSPSVKKLRGYTPEEVLVQPLNEALTENSIAVVAGAMEKNVRLFNEGKTDQMDNYLEVDQPCKDGSIVNTEVVTTFIPDSNGKLDFILGVSRNITERKKIENKLKESERFLKQVIKNAPTPVALLDYNGGTGIDINDKFSEVFGYTLEDIPALDAWWLLAYPDPEYREYLMNTWLNEITFDLDDLEETRAIDAWVTTKNGDKKYCDFKGIRIGSVLVVFINDLTERKIKENEIKALSGQKDRLLSIIAHDLKTPFHHIMGYSEVLTEEFDTLDEAEKKRIMQLLRKTADVTYGLLEHLLDWGRIQMKRISFEPAEISLHKILKEISSDLNDMNSRKNITITTKLDKPVFLVADRYMLSTILRNLISNAVKFSFPGSEVVVSAVKEHDSILISVKDSGTGISEEDLPRLFSLDDQCRSTGTEGEKGTGLGLILAKEFTEKHGGSIEVKSTPGLGSTFTVKLPAAPDISRVS